MARIVFGHIFVGLSNGFLIGRLMDYTREHLEKNRQSNLAALDIDRLR